MSAPHPGHRPAASMIVSLTTALLCVLGPLDSTLKSGAGVLLAQQRDTARIPSAVLLKRLSEAVDGHRTGSTVFVIASYDPPHTVAGVAERRDDAETLARSLGPQFDTFGPFKSQQDPGTFAAFLMKCVHDGRTSMWDPYCPEGPFIPLADVDSLAVTVWLRNGESRTLPVPKGTDAAFFTLSAIDKFVIPYYTRILGVADAASMRERIVRSLTRP